MSWRAAGIRQGALAKAREVIEERQAEEAAWAERRRKLAMTTRKSKHGTVQLPPRIDPILEAANEAMAELRDAVAEVIEAGRQDDALDAARAPRRRP